MPLPHLLDAVERLPQFTRVVNTLPAPKRTLTLAGLHGSGDAVFVAALARRLPGRLVVVVCDALPEAERWLADLGALTDGDGIALYPPREGFGEIEPHAEVAGERVETLEALARGRVRLLLTTSRALMERTQLARAVAEARLELRKGDTWRPEDLAAHLDAHGYERVPMLDDVGQYAVRGGIFDIYGFGMAEPVRLEFWGDEIIELRHFDLVTQRSARDAQVALVLPVDVPTTTSGDGSYDRVTLPELLPPDALVVRPLGTSVEPELRRTWDEAAHHVALARRRGEGAPPREQLFVAPEQAMAMLAAFGTLRVSDPAVETPDVGFPLRAPEHVGRDMQALRALLRVPPPTLILCDNTGQLERLDELLSEGRQGPSAQLALGVLGAGFVVPAADGREGLRVLTDHEIFRRERRIRRARKYAGGGALDVVTALKPGDYVVHLDHGIGIYRGMSTTFVNEATVEVAVIEYEGGDRLNVPLHRIDQIERYRAAGDTGGDTPPPRLHKLGGRRWSQQRDRTRAAILEMTHELLDLYARRKVASRPSHVPDTPWQKQLESGFLFEDTPDQRKATDDVKRDMEGARPMDRLLVGDVGYGKTEIAVRAAFKAVQSGRQVAVLVPTTILADQHFRTFGDRLADFPVKVGALSRFQTAKEQADVLRQLKAKELDVVVGTHRLLSEDVVFADLGLIIVDEEQPIPRTLHQSLAGLRDMTLMQTPPRDRSPVLTYVEPNDDGLVEEALGRELDRGGQVFFVHNRIETIEAVADHLRRVVPRARIAVGHGQMREKELEEVMRRFVHGEVDVLVSTMIVESGLDVPNANTMFVDRADHFGLAQLY
nr:DEAD/DEAH box helicase [Gemmatimonadaceae bacterium]